MIGRGFVLGATFLLTSLKTSPLASEWRHAWLVLFMHRMAEIVEVESAMARGA